MGLRLRFRAFGGLKIGEFGFLAKSSIKVLWCPTGSSGSCAQTRDLP